MNLSSLSRRRVLWALPGSAALMSSPSFAQSGPIKIGGTLPLTGGNASIGKVAQATAQIWADDINKRGGLLGRKVELVIYDDQTNPTLVPGLYTKLLDVDKVDLLAGTGTNLVAPAMPLLIERKRLIVANLALAVNDPFNYDKYFQIMPYGPNGKDELARGFFEIAAKLNPKPKTVALVGADAEFANNALEGARDHAKRLGFRVVYDKSYPPNQVDFLSVVRAIAATKPDLVFVGSYVADTSGLVRAAAEVKLKCTMFGGAMVGLQVAALKQQLSGVINGVVNYELYLPEPTMQFQGTRELINRYRAVASAQGLDQLGFYVPPTTFAQLQVLEQAVTATKSLQDEVLADYLRKNSFKTVMGDIRFGARGEWAEPRILMTQFQKVNGKELGQFDQPGTQVILYPEKFKSGQLAAPFPLGG
ncbi:MAG: branched-chain amino acid ABC transporter substrate-binding protein [Betaproteobacteria bacterium]|nr:branched-chain amino acid ABC transporter substrate-binding protein [Betaproteobacteria bacterium]